MFKLLHTVLITIALIGFSSGCAISHRVSPVASAPAITKIYVQRNPKVLMEGLHPEILQQLKTTGFDVESFDQSRPKDATYMITYTANWKWDMAMYLTYFQLSLMEDEKVLGTVEYDARRGGANLGKFGKTADKIRPLIIDLLKNVPRSSGTATSIGK